MGLLDKINFLLMEKNEGKTLCVDCDSVPAKKGSRYCASCAKSRHGELKKFQKEQKGKK